MAIAGIPTNFYCQSAGGAQAYLLWDIIAGATSYQIQRSTDGVNFSNLTTSATPYYLDTTVTLGTRYFYQVASINGSGTSGFCSPQMVIPAPAAEMTLYQLRGLSQARADRVNSNFVTLPEWNTFINQAMYELYDLLVTVYEDYFIATPAQFPTQGTTYLYPLPDGSTSFVNGVSGVGGYVAPPFYKLMGVDLSVSANNNGWVSIEKFDFANRNQYVFPNTASTIYGVFNLKYRVLGNNIEFIPTPSAGQNIRLWYIPRLQPLLQENDITTIGFSGWLQYVIVRAAKYALDKEESDTSKLDAELAFLKGRIEESASNRDAGKPDRISDVRTGLWGTASGGMGWPGPIGGF